MAQMIAFHAVMRDGKPKRFHKRLLKFARTIPNAGSRKYIPAMMRSKRMRITNAFKQSSTACLKGAKVMTEYKTVNEFTYGDYGNWVHEARDIAGNLGKLKAFDQKLANYPTLVMWLYIVGKSSQELYDEL